MSGVQFGEILRPDHDAAAITFHLQVPRSVLRELGWDGVTEWQWGYNISSVSQIYLSPAGYLEAELRRSRQELNAYDAERAAKKPLARVKRLLRGKNESP